MDYESQRAQIEEQIQRQKELAIKQQEEDIKQNTELIKQMIHNDSQISDVQTYEDARKQIESLKPNMEELMRQFEDSRKVMTASDVDLELKCKKVLETMIETKLWKRIQATSDNVNTFWDTEHNHLWTMDVSKLRNGAWKPEKRVYDNMLNQHSELRLIKSTFVYNSQPNGYMFKTDASIV